MVIITSGQQYNVGERPTVILHTYYIHRHRTIIQYIIKKDSNNAIIASLQQ